MNTAISRLTLVLAAVLLALATGCAGDSKRESTGEYIDDTAITAKVKAAILDDPTLKVLQINVVTYRGTVQLSGFVESRAMAERAVAAAKRVAGVKAIRDDMRIR
ncbi:MAG: transporter [Betaproteobacteria bacterium RIFCSPLOWO2_02_FULL_67_19]|nr:MAG: transporter [Betaproteobacteria bacterium RIFCSPLOWO2_02_FULL_67_19]